MGTPNPLGGAKNFSWTPAIVEALKALFAEGLSSSAIGAQLGCSRNAVIGKVHRLGIGGSRPPKPPRPIRAESVRGRRDPIFKPRLAAPAPPPPPEPVEASVLEAQSRGLDLLELTEKLCKFPFGSGPYTFCGADVVEGSPYCAGHASICYEPPAARRSREEPKAAAPLRRSAAA